MTMTLRLLLVVSSLIVSYGFSSSSVVLSRPSSLVTRDMTMIFGTTTTPDRDPIVQQFLAMSRRIGPVGSLASIQDQQALEQLAMKLEPLSDKDPTSRPLRGIHHCLYSAAPGGSSGRLVGPFYGKVTQDFLVDGETFINAVQFGPLQISLKATKSVKTTRRNMVKFRETTVRLFGQTIVQKELKGGGVWDYIFIGEVTDVDGTSKLIRVMKTPSLFVLEQNL